MAGEGPAQTLCGYKVNEAIQWPASAQVFLPCKDCPAKKGQDFAASIPVRELLRGSPSNQVVHLSTRLTRHALQPRDSLAHKRQKGKIPIWGPPRPSPKKSPRTSLRRAPGIGHWPSAIRHANAIFGRYSTDCPTLFTQFPFPRPP